MTATVCLDLRAVSPAIRPSGSAGFARAGCTPLTSPAVLDHSRPSLPGGLSRHDRLPVFRHPRRVQASEQRRLLSAGALAVVAPWPAAGPTLTFLQLLLGPTYAAFSGHPPLGIFDPADELVAGQRRDVLPGIECRGVGDQRLAQVSWKLVHRPTGHSRAAHTVTVAGQGSSGRRGSP
jgi:hypothetical protein